MPDIVVHLARMSSKDATAEPLLQAEGTRPLSAQIYARVVEAILRGDFGAQGKLPTESELAASYGLSRPTIREALSPLRSDRVIDSKRDAGIIVVRMPVTPTRTLTPIRSLADVQPSDSFGSCVKAGA